MIALDTNLLVYNFVAGVAEHEKAARAFEAAAADGRGWGFALGSAVEFWNIATRPAAPLGSAEEAARYLADLSLAGAHLWLPPARFGSRMFAEAVASGIRGRRIFDWQIALTAMEHGATELWTHDRGFRAPAALRIVDPLL